MLIWFKGQAPATYDVAAGNAYVGYGDAGGQMYLAWDQVPGTSGSVIVASYGAVGELIVGTFTIVANEWDMVNNQPSLTTKTATGNFSLTRLADTP